LEKIEKKCLKREITETLTELANFSLFRLVVDSFELMTEKHESIFLKLQTEELCHLTFEVFGVFESYIDHNHKQKFWEEVLKELIENYFINIFIGENECLKEIKLLRNKIKEDIKIINGAFADKLEENLIKQNLRHLGLILEFMEIGVDMIALSCSSFLEFHGNSFEMKNLKHLIELRTDLSGEEKKEANITCKEVFENYKKNHKENNKVKNKYFHKPKLSDKLNDMISHHNLKNKEKNHKENQLNIEEINNLMGDGNHDKQLKGRRGTIKNANFLTSVNENKHVSKKDLADYGVDVSESHIKEKNGDDSSINVKSKVITFFQQYLQKEEERNETIQINYANNEVILSGELKKCFYGM